MVYISSEKHQLRACDEGGLVTSMARDFGILLLKLITILGAL